MFAAFDSSIRRQFKSASRALSRHGVSPLAFAFALGALQLALLLNLFVKVWIIQEARDFSEAMSLSALFAGYLVFMAIAMRRVSTCLALPDEGQRRRSLARLLLSRRKEEVFGRLFSVFIALGAISALPDLLVGSAGLHAEAGLILSLTIVDAARQYWLC